MVEVRMTAAELRALARVDLERVRNTSAEEIDRHIAEDGENDADWCPTPASVRQILGMTQTEIARLLHVPVGTWRNWEQNRGRRRDPAVQALLRILAREPEAARRALGMVA